MRKYTRQLTSIITYSIFRGSKNIEQPFAMEFVGSEGYTSYPTLHQSFLGSTITSHTMWCPDMPVDIYSEIFAAHQLSTNQLSLTMFLVESCKIPHDPVSFVPYFNHVQQISRDFNRPTRPARPDWTCRRCPRGSDAEFDPLGFSDTFDIKWLREPLDVSGPLMAAVMAWVWLFLWSYRNIMEWW